MTESWSNIWSAVVRDAANITYHIYYDPLSTGQEAQEKWYLLQRYNAINAHKPTHY